MALIQMTKSSGSATFGELSQKYEAIVTTTLRQNGCRRVDLVFDHYRSVSNKAGEPRKRGESSSLEVNIHSGSTPVPKQWQKCISNPKNKVNLAEFLCKSFGEHLPARSGPLQRVVLADGFRDGSKLVSLVQGSVTVEPHLSSDHEEADTRLLLHANHAATIHPRIVIQSPDTDVAVLSVAHFEDLGCQELWFITGVRDRQRYIPVHTNQSSFCRPLWKSLLPCHALTGCDSTSAFSGIGKKKAWKVMLSKKQLQQDLSSLGVSPVTQDPVHEVAESFICSIYTFGKNFSSADDARYYLFCQKSVKSGELPPTSDCLSRHIKRANFQPFIWKRALVPLQNVPPAEGNGWKFENDKLVPVLMTKSPAQLRCTMSECKRSCSCRVNYLACTEACLCMADEGCSNSLYEELLSYDSSESETT